jgi:integrase
MAAEHLALTEPLIRSLPFAQSERDRYLVYDTRAPGLVVRVGAATKVFVVMRKIKGFGSESKKRTLGRFEIKGGDPKAQLLTLSKARELTHSFVLRMREGRDPLREIMDQGKATQAAHEARKRTMAVAWQEWAVTTSNTVSDKTRSDRGLAYRLLTQSPIFRLPYATITVKQVSETFRPLFEATVARKLNQATGQLHPPAPTPAWLKLKSKQPSPSTAAKLYGYCRAAWTYTAELDELPGRNPFDTWRRTVPELFPQKVKRKGHLRTDKPEGADAVSAMEAFRRHDNPTVACGADLVMLILLWGSRRLETMRLRWSDVDFDECQVRFRPENVKTGKDGHLLPLTPWAMEILLARRAANEARALPAGSDDWVFSSRRRSRVQANELRAAEQEGRQPASWALSLTHIKSVEDVLVEVQEKVGRRITLHDLRRTVAGELAIDAIALEAAAQALNHTSHGGFAQTQDYVQDHARVQAMRPRFERHEQRIRGLAGLAEAVSTTLNPATLTDQQRWALEMAKKMLKDAGLDSTHL